MTTKGIGHVKIGNRVFQLAEQVGSGASTFLPHYSHDASTLLSNRTNIDGKPGRQNIRPEVFFFAQDDWSGGLGQKFYDPGKPTKYYRGSGNPRVPGYLAGAPTRTTNDGPTTDFVATPVLASGGGFLWMATMDPVATGTHPLIWQSQDMQTWESFEATDGNDGDVTWPRQLAVDQNGNCYMSEGTSTDITYIIRFKTNGNATTFFQRGAHDFDTTSNLGIRGMAVHREHLFAWTGINLYQMRCTDTSLPTNTGVLVGNAGPDDISTDFVCSADITNCGDGVVMFTSQLGNSRVYEYRGGGTNTTATAVGGVTTTVGDPEFSQIWKAPDDVLIEAISYMDGKVYVVGNQDFGVTMWSIDLSNRQIAPVLRLTPDLDGFDL